MDSSLKTEEIAADPFAADIFAGVRLQNENSAETDVGKLNLWSEHLPAAALPATDWNKLLNGSAPEFSEKLTRSLADLLTRLLDLPDENAVEIVFSVNREINAAEDFAPESGNSFWLTIVVEAGDAEIYLEIDNNFAVSLVDVMLGETAAGGAQIRELTRSETAVIEFLSVNLTHEINLILQSPLFKFRSLSSKMPGSLRQKSDLQNPSLLVSAFQIVHESLPAVVNLYLAPESLRALQKDENRLFNNRPRLINGRNLQSKIESLRMRLRCGTSELSLAELASLENGDIILLENHNFVIGGGNLDGYAEFFLGDGENAKIAGQFAENDFGFDEFNEENTTVDKDKTLIRRLNVKRGWQFVVGHLTEIENPVSSEKSMTETEENFTDETAAAATDEAAADETNGLAIENLAVTLRVELEARRLTIAEIANLRENQTLELGISPTDTVNILIDNQRVGRGELVTVEGRLGVRITKLLR